mmetsp:Transcript_43078/g.93820  ORF Transcript_43078/g.93820 Transcript_43078/m.93820 type:complete len:201 (+) Transcript_43078:1866-2468(+)
MNHARRIHDGGDAAKDDLAGTLGVDSVCAVFPGHRPGHHLTCRGEGLRGALGRRLIGSAHGFFPDLIEVIAKVRGELQQGALRRIADEVLCSILRDWKKLGLIHGAHADEVATKGLHVLRNRGVGFHDRPYRLMVHDVSLKELPGQPCCPNSHAVGSERAGLVRADCSRRAHRLARVQGLHEILLLRHAVGREGKRDGER